MPNDGLGDCWGWKGEGFHGRDHKFKTEKSQGLKGCNLSVFCSTWTGSCLSMGVLVSTPGEYYPVVSEDGAMSPTVYFEDTRGGMDLVVDRRGHETSRTRKGEVVTDK